MVGDAWPKGPDQIVFDIAVNSGTGRAPQIMGAAMGVSTRNPRDLAALASRSADTVGIVKRACASFYRSLRTFSAFGRGCSRDAIANFRIGLKGILAITRTIIRYRRQKCG